MSDNNLSKLDSTEETKGILPEEVSEVLNEIPMANDQRKMIEALFVSQTSMISRVSPEIEVSKKVTSEHISTMLDTEQQAMKHTFEDRKQSRIFNGFVILAACAVLIALVILLRDNPAVMEKIITAVVSALLGGGAGYGLGMIKNKNDN